MVLLLGIKWQLVNYRLDQIIVDRGLAESRSRAQALVMAGLVFSGDRKLEKPGQQLPEDAPVDVRGRDHPWVSRGGIKLAHAIDAFGLDPAGATAMDIGSSTGGFTDVLLQKGAARVFAVDSGTNQLAWKLRQDPRVTVLEQTSARILTAQQIEDRDWEVVSRAERRIETERESLFGRSRHVADLAVQCTGVDHRLCISFTAQNDHEV